MKHVFLIISLLITACSSPSANTGVEESNTEKKQSMFQLNDYRIQLDLFNMEVTGKCPVLTLFAKNTVNHDPKKELDTLTLCKVEIEGYRLLDAQKDFAFIDFTQFHVIENELWYEIDLSLLQGSSFIAMCKVSVIGDKFFQQACSK